MSLDPGWRSCSDEPKPEIKEEVPMRRVLKFRFSPGVTTLKVPVGKGARLVAVGQQYQQVAFWMDTVDDEPASAQAASQDYHDKNPRTFHLADDGVDVPLNYEYRGTAITWGDLVHHLYEVV